MYSIRPHNKGDLTSLSRFGLGRSKICTSSQRLQDPERFPQKSNHRLFRQFFRFFPDRILYTEAYSVIPQLPARAVVSHIHIAHTSTELSRSLSPGRFGSPFERQRRIACVEAMLRSQSLSDRSEYMKRSLYQQILLRGDILEAHLNVKDGLPVQKHAIIAVCSIQFYFAAIYLNVKVGLPVQKRCCEFKADLIGPNT